MSGRRIEIGGQKIKGGISEPTANIGGRKSKEFLDQITTIVGPTMNEIHAVVVTVDDLLCGIFVLQSMLCRRGKPARQRNN